MKGTGVGRCWPSPGNHPLSRILMAKDSSMAFRDLTYAINGAVYEVHNVLGGGFLEKVYENALLIELKKIGVNAKAQIPVSIYYKGDIVGEYIADLVVEDKIILELKTVDDLTSVHQAQLINYLKASDKKLGLLINFKGPKATIRRIALEE